MCQERRKNIKKYLEVNGNTICVDDTGDESKKPILLYHGLTGSKEGMYDVRGMLKDDCRVITVDTRGHGESTRPEAYTLADHAEDVHALIQALGFDKVDLLGYSMGSYVVTAAAEKFCDDIDHLFIVTSKPSGATSSVARILKESGLDIRTAPPEEFNRIVVRAAYAPKTLERLDRGEKLPTPNTGDDASVVPLTSEQKTAEDASLADFDNGKALDQITCKTMVISGEFDRVNPADDGKVIADGIPGAEFVVIPDAGGHMMAVEQPDLLKKTILDFLKK